MATLSAFNFTVEDETGKPFAKAEISVFEEASNQAADIYQDREGTKKLTNPFQAASPTVVIFAKPGAYRIEAKTANAQIVHPWRYVALGTAGEHNTEDFVTRAQSEVFTAAEKHKLDSLDPNAPVSADRVVPGPSKAKLSGDVMPDVVDHPMIIGTDKSATGGVTLQHTSPQLSVQDGNFAGTVTAKTLKGEFAGNIAANHVTAGPDPTNPVFLNPNVIPNPINGPREIGGVRLNNSTVTAKTAIVDIVAAESLPYLTLAARARDGNGIGFYPAGAGNDPSQPDERWKKATLSKEGNFDLSGWLHAKGNISADGTMTAKDFGGVGLSGGTVKADNGNFGKNVTVAGSLRVDSGITGKASEATHADNATNANHAKNADNATNAVDATTAKNADNALAVTAHVEDKTLPNSFGLLGAPLGTKQPFAPTLYAGRLLTQHFKPAGVDFEACEAALKENFRPIDEIETIIKAVEPGLFEWAETDAVDEAERGQTEYGFQNIGKAVPLVAREIDDPEDGKIAAYDRVQIAPLLWAGLKAALERIEALEAKLDETET